MAYDPGALNAALAAAVGNDSDLMAELKGAFVESARRQLDLLGRSRCDANWQIAAARLKSIAASFGVAGLIELSDEALQGAPGDRRCFARSAPRSTNSPKAEPRRFATSGPRRYPPPKRRDSKWRSQR